MEIEYSKQQLEAIDAIVAWFQNVYKNPSAQPDEREFYLAGYAGVGKSQPLYEKILTPSGWTEMGKIKRGDDVVGSTGRPIKVTGVFPQLGNRRVYRVYFTDRSYVDSCEDHLWTVWDKKGRSRVVNTKYFTETSLKNSAGYRIRIKTPNAIQFKEINVPLCPYIYGYILGDGYLAKYRGANITSWVPDIEHITKMMNSADIPHRVGAGGPTTRRIYIADKYAGFIPREKSICKKILPEYLYNSIETRKKLLAGLLDSDGTCYFKSETECKIRYSTFSIHLKNGIVELVKSLGGSATWFRAKRDGEFCVSIQTPFNPFILPRKAANWRMPKYNSWVGIKSLEYIGEMPTQCISVDAEDSLYITKDYILTHNTTLAKGVGEKLSSMFGISNIISCSYTGKACDVLRNKGMPNPMTIHRMIYSPIKDKITGKVRFELSSWAPANQADLIICDEVSMVDKKMAADLRSFRKPMLIMGDPGQLPPISGTGFVIGREPDYFLTEIHRQVADSPILKLATMARNGERIPPGVYGDTVLVTDKFDEDTLNNYVMKKGTQPICGANKTRYLINRTFRKRLGFQNFPYPQAGEKLICCQNSSEEGLFNGMMGVAYAPANDEGGVNRKCDIFFQSDSDGLKTCVPSWKSMFERNYHEHMKEPEYVKGVQKFDYGYCLTCHKSQGSEWDTVTLIDESWMFKEQSHKWLYTGITRAAKRLIVIQK